METLLIVHPFIPGSTGREKTRELDIQLEISRIIVGMKALWDSDARLIDAILAGDTAAWQKFILNYSNFIYRAFVAYTDDYDEKMAVYLYILEKLRENRCQRLRSFAFKSKLSTWLTVVARRLALDYLRSRYGRDFALKRLRVVSIDGEPDYTRLLSDMRTPETEMSRAEKLEHRQQLGSGLRQALEKLTDRERLAVQLVYFQGLKINEVGRLLQLPGAYKFLTRVLKKIRDEMERAPGYDRAGMEDALEGEAHD